MDRLNACVKNELVLGLFSSCIYVIVWFEPHKRGTKTASHYDKLAVVRVASAVSSREEDLAEASVSLQKPERAFSRHPCRLPLINI